MPATGLECFGVPALKHRRTTLSRRTVLGAGVATLATAGAAVAAPAFPELASPEVDRRLLQLCRNWHRRERVFNRLVHNYSVAEEAFWAQPIPPKPAILLKGFEVFPGDDGHALKPDLYQSDYSAASDKVPHLHRWALEPVAEGSFYLEAHLLPGGAADDKTLVPIPQEARDRAKACLAALDQWEAAEKVRHAQVDHWEAKMDRLNDLQYKVAEAIVELPALTMQGVNAKLSIVSANPYYAEDRGITASVAHDARRIDGNALLSPPVAA